MPRAEAQPTPPLKSLYLWGAPKIVKTGFSLADTLSGIRLYANVTESDLNCGDTHEDTLTREMQNLKDAAWIVVGDSDSAQNIVANIQTKGGLVLAFSSSRFATDTLEYDTFAEISDTLLAHWQRKHTPEGAAN